MPNNHLEPGNPGSQEAGKPGNRETGKPGSQETRNSGKVTPFFSKVAKKIKIQNPGISRVFPGHFPEISRFPGFELFHKILIFFGEFPEILTKTQTF